MYHFVGVGDFVIVDGIDDIVKTFGLGSCVALIIYCPVRKILGMSHIALPDSSIDPNKAMIKPGYFADTAFCQMMQEFVLRGCDKNNLQVQLYGGAQAVWDKDIFNIGSRNLAALEERLLCYGLGYNKTDTGGHYSRTVEVTAATGRVNLISHSLAQWRKNK